MRHLAISRVVVLLAVLLAGGRSASGQMAPKWPVPSDAAQSAAMKLVKEVYGDEYKNAKTLAEKQSLAEKLLKKADETRDDPAGRFVLLRLAKDIAIQGKDGMTAYRAAEATAASFQIDLLELKAEILPALAKRTQTVVDHKSMVAPAWEVADGALARDNFTIAGDLFRLALAEAQAGHDAELVKKAEARVAEVEELQKADQESRKAAAVLEANPIDPAANLAVGKYRCLLRGDWDTGLPMLALCDTPTLKDLATKDLRGPTTSADRAALGDQWWDFAELQEGLVQRHAYARARYWYLRAMPGLTGLIKAKVEKRLAQESAATDVATTALPAKSRRGLARMYVIGDDAFDFYVNGVRLTKSEDGQMVDVKECRFLHGDVIAVKVTSTGKGKNKGKKGFCCAILFEDGRKITTGPAWRSYQPKKDAEWYHPRNIGEVSPVEPGARPRTEDIIRNASGLPAKNIWGHGNPSYLVYVVR